MHLHFVLGQFRAGLLADVLPHVPPALGSVLAETRFTAAARGPAVEYPVGIRPDITRPELFFTLIAKGVLSLVIWGGYLQLTEEFNILGRLSALSGKFFKR